MEHNTKLIYKFKPNDVRIYPKIEFITNNLVNNNYFTFAKISVEWWQLFCKAIKDLNVYNNIEIIQSKKFAEQMVYIWDTSQKKGKGGSGSREDWEVTTDIFKDVIIFLTKICPKNFIMGITDRTPGRQYVKTPIYPDYTRGRHKIIMETIKRVIPKENKIYDAMCWKYWGASGEFKKIIDVANKKNMQVILVGPYYFEKFGSIYGIKNFSYISIHDAKAALYVQQYKKEIIKLDKEITKNKIYLIQGGAAAMWLCCELHGVLNNAFIFDAGKGLDHYIKRLNPTHVHKIL